MAAVALVLLSAISACSGDEDAIVLASKLEVHYRELTGALNSIRDMESAKAAVAKIKAIYPAFEKDRAAVNAMNKLAFTDAERARVEGLSNDLVALMKALVEVRPPELLKYIREQTAGMGFDPPAVK